MKKLVLITALALFSLPATAALAVPMCDRSVFTSFNAKGEVVFDEIKAAEQAELQLRSEGIHAHMTRFWNGCIQTFVNVDGKDVMKFYDPNSLREIEVN
jgi:hypothetical protein